MKDINIMVNFQHEQFWGEEFLDNLVITAEKRELNMLSLHFVSCQQLSLSLGNEDVKVLKSAKITIFSPKMPKLPHFIHQYLLIECSNSVILKSNLIEKNFLLQAVLIKFMQTDSPRACIFTIFALYCISPTSPTVHTYQVLGIEN